MKFWRQKGLDWVGCPILRGQRSHTISSRKACTGTAKIGTDLRLLWCVLRTDPTRMLLLWVLRCLCQPFNLNSICFNCTIRFSGTVMFGFPVGSTEHVAVPFSEGMRGNWINQQRFLSVSFCLWRNERRIPVQPVWPPLTLLLYGHLVTEELPHTDIGFTCLHKVKDKNRQNLQRTLNRSRANSLVEAYFCSVTAL